MSPGDYDPKKEHLVVYPGLNLMGRCFNKACTASKHPANISWIRKGYGTFYIGESACNNKCQSCKQPINPKYVQTIGFSRAKLTIEGCMKVNETETANIHKTAE